MKVGDLVEFRLPPSTASVTRWKVTRRVANERVCHLLNWEGETLILPDDLDEAPDPSVGEVAVVAHPSDTWPFVAAPVKARGGPIRRVLRNGQDLAPLIDWVPSNLLRNGGSLFFNPSLQLRPGEVLVAVHEKNNTRSRVTVTRAFGTIKRRRLLANPPASAPRTVYDRLMSNDLFDDE